MSEARFIVSDVVDAMANIPDGSIDLIVTSPPFLALRSYLPADHPDKHKEIGSEATPAMFLSTLLALTREWRRVLAPHGSLCVELGDTYSGSGARGGDYLDEDETKRTGATDRQIEMLATHVDRDDDDKYTGQRLQDRRRASHNGNKNRDNAPGWPLDKSLCLIPTSYAWALAYGHSPFNPDDRLEPWRIRNQIVWHRPNPPVGGLGDKVRPSTSYITVACTSRTRWFDLDAERGAVEGPPLDCWHDTTTEDVWTLPTQPYSGKIVTVRRVPCGPDDGGERTASPDCPRHGDLPGRVPKALRDERAAARQAAQPRISHNGSHRDPEQLDGFAPTDENRDREGSSRVPTSVPLGPECGPAATPRDMGSSRTDLARSTSQPDTPFARTTAGTARMSVSPESSAQGDCTAVSSTTSGDLAANRGPQMPGDIADIPPSESPCSCSFHKVVKESTSHYATFPPALPRKLINLMCPRQVCRECGEPRRRIVEVDYTPTQATNNATPRAAIHGVNGAGSDPTFVHGRATKNVETLGWTDCECGPYGTHTKNYRRGIVLDPFAGSGTTLVAASELGRDSIGIDLDSRNLDLARQRCGMFLIEEDEVTA